MKSLTTITGREIKISANQSHRTFTIRVSSGKYRSYPMTRQEFEHARDNWTGNDWHNFLRSTGEYYPIK
jgi:hypothetical protein